MNISAFAAGLLLVPLVDQTLKFLLRRRLRTGSVPLGSLGSVRVVPARIWLARANGGLSRSVLWTLWLTSAGVLTALAVLVPPLGWCGGLLLGGSFSHALETSLRGSVMDYVCLRFWPAFNIADVAIVAGGLGLTGNLLFLMTTTT